MQKGNIWVKVLSTVGAVVILGVLVWYGLKIYQNKNFINNNQNINNTVSTTINENLDSVINNNASSSDRIYKNTEFGIQITIPVYIKDYKILSEINKDKEGEDYVNINFYLPMSKEEESNFGGCGLSDIVDSNFCYKKVFGFVGITKHSLLKIVGCKLGEEERTCPVPQRKIGNYYYSSWAVEDGFIGSYNNTNFVSEILNSLKPLTN